MDGWKDGMGWFLRSQHHLHWLMTGVLRLRCHLLLSPSSSVTRFLFFSFLRSSPWGWGRQQ